MPDREYAGRDMKRREFLGVASGAVITLPVVGHSQQAMPVVGFLGTGTAAPYERALASFAEGVKIAGYVVGRNVAIEYRWAEGRYERMPEMVADLLSRRVAVMVAAGGNAPAQAAKAASSVTPIVFISGGDPVRGGLVVRLNRPEGNVTGVTMMFPRSSPNVLSFCTRSPRPVISPCW